jgi:hypothetical protein
MAEHAGAVSPDGMQRLDQLGDPGTGVFLIDETGFVKKGVRSAGWPASTGFPTVPTLPNP